MVVLWILSGIALVVYIIAFIIILFKIIQSILNIVVF